MRKRIFKSIAAVMLITTISATTVLADDINTLKNQKDQQQKELDSLEDDLAYLLSQMGDLELKMAKISQDINDANVKLADAEEVQQAQYDDMKLRIKYMYEDQSVSIAEVFLTSTDMSSMLNKAVYMQEVYDYDRNKLDEMANTAAEIKSLKEDLENDQQELEVSQKSLHRNRLFCMQQLMIPSLQSVI